jgi:hypothetical protein
MPAIAEPNDELVFVYIGRIKDEMLSFNLIKADVPPFITNDVTMVPLRSLSEEFGYVVDYEEDKRQISIINAFDGNELVFVIGSTSVLRNGQKDTVLQSPIIHNGRTFIPLRYISGFYGQYVLWEPGNYWSAKEPEWRECIHVWVSEIPLLAWEEVDVTDDDNYYVYPPSIIESPIYKLKNECFTYRGIKIGDSYEKVLELYGEPHRKGYTNSALAWVEYRTHFIPNSSSGIAMTFYLDNMNVYDVSVNGPS